MDEQLFKALSYLAGLFLALAGLTLFFQEYGATARMIEAQNQADGERKGAYVSTERAAAYTDEDVVCYLYDHLGETVQIDHLAPLVITEEAIGSIITTLEADHTYAYSIEEASGCQKQVCFRKE